MDAQTIIYIIAGLTGLFILGLFVTILLPNKALPDVDLHNIGDHTSGGMLRGIIGEL